MWTTREMTEPVWGIYHICQTQSSKTKFQSQLTFNFILEVGHAMCKSITFFFGQKHFNHFSPFLYQYIKTIALFINKKIHSWGALIVFFSKIHLLIISFQSFFYRSQNILASYLSTRCVSNRNIANIHNTRG